MKKIVCTLIVISLAGCTTPTAMLRNDKTGQVVQCGGNMSGSILLGVVGYEMQKANDATCESDYMAQGFKRISKTDQAGNPVVDK